MKKLLVLALVLAATNAFAANSLGVFFDTAGTQTSKVYGAGATVTAYVVARDFTQTGLAEFEFHVETSPNILDSDLAFLFNTPTACVNVLTPPDFMVGVAPAFPTTAPLWLVRVRFPMNDPEELVKIGVGPSLEVTSFPGMHVAGYGNGAATILTPFVPSSNVDPIPGMPGFYYLAQCNGQNVVAIDNNSWSGVKSLYR